MNIDGLKIFNWYINTYEGHSFKQLYFHCFRPFNKSFLTVKCVFCVVNEVIKVVHVLSLSPLRRGF